MEPQNEFKSKVPKQVAPVQRDCTSASLSNEQGVEASFLGSNMWNAMRLYGKL
jgi:hypothetical protein